MQFKELQNDIAIGVISRERDFGAKAERYALLDKLPPGSIFTTQIFFESKKSINNHLSDLEAAAVGQGAVVGRVMQNISTARDELEANNTLLRTSEAIYIRGEDDEELFEIENNIRSLLESSNLSLQASSEDIRLMDSYLRFLPFNYDYEFEQRYKRGSYKYADDVAKIIPVYGRFRGDGQNPLQIKFNRAGEPVIFDFLNKNFKSSNSHVALIGTSGSGKSVEMNSMIVSLSAVYNPHIIALEVGGSFDITAEYLKEHGRSVRRIKFDPKNVVPQNPYAESYKALEIIEKREKEIGVSSGELAEAAAKKIGDEIDGIQDEASDAELECTQERDLLSEMLLATRIAITGGKPEEEAKLTRADLSYISQNLISTVRRCRDSGKKQMRLSHVKQGFESMAENEANQALSEKFRYFAATLDLFISDQIKAPFVDRESEPLGDYDFMQIDFGFMQDALYEDLLNMTCISILGRILSLAEANKDSGRPTILLLDEAHILFKSPMIAAFITLMTKVSRKIGLWIIAGTQNVEDFSGVESKKVLSMLETWILLSLDQSEIKLVEKFKTLTDEMRYLLKSVKKVQGLYSEGVLIGKRYSGLFRNVPPRLNLALAMTEQSERTERRKIKEELGVSELEAVKHIAKKLESPKERAQIDGDFYD